MDPTANATDHVDGLLAQWAEQRPDLDTGLLAVTARIVRLGRYLDRDATDHLAPFGLHEGEVNVLAALRRAGPPHVLTPTELYRALLVSSGAMTNRLDGLESRGLLVREPDPDDRRRVRVGLTDAGREVIDAAIDAHVAGLASLLSAVHPDDARRLADLLRDVLRPLERDDPEA
jgi:DNA-binding MarR family transcriptional regulator